MPKTLFICSGNIARSQMAEGFYNHHTHTSDGFSAGTNPLAPERYKVVPDMMVDIMKEKGVDIHGQKVKYVTEEMVRSAERIYVMCEKEKCPDFLAGSAKVEYWAVADPHYMSLEDTKKIRDTIEEKVLSLI